MSNLSLADVAVSILEWQVVVLVVIGVTCAFIATALAAGCAWTFTKEWRSLGGRPAAAGRRAPTAPGSR